MSNNLVHFLLIENAASARRLRRLLAADSPRQGVIVGTWVELIEQAKKAYLVPPRSNEWKARFFEALESIPEAFWANSLEVAREETAAEVEAALSLMVSATEPGVDIDLTHIDKISDRPRKHVHDIVRLISALDGLLPDELFGTQQGINADAESAIRKIAVYHVEGFISTTRWQDALIKKLNADAGIEFDTGLKRHLQLLSAGDTALNPENCLQQIQTHLFGSPEEKLPLDATVQWIGVRDFQQEAEVAAGMVQNILAQNNDVALAEIGLLVPDAFEYSLAVNDAFTVAGLPLSGLPVDHWQRDLGRELLFHFLYCRQKPSPVLNCIQN